MYQALPGFPEAHPELQALWGCLGVRVLPSAFLAFQEPWERPGTGEFQVFRALLALRADLEPEVLLSLY